MRPLMVVVGGPSGSGKSSAFPVAQAEIDFFNIDDRAAALNGGSYQSIPPAIRSQANRECEAFISEHIREGKGFAVETTLRSEITFEQAREARENGFLVEMRYVALDRVETNIERVAARALAGGHAASPRRIRAIHRSSLSHLVRGMRQFDIIRVYDNSEAGGRPRLVLSTRAGLINFIVESPPLWLIQALHGTEYEIAGTLGEST